jgi:hypothetical protein
MVCSGTALALSYQSEPLPQMKLPSVYLPAHVTSKWDDFLQMKLTANDMRAAELDKKILYD